MFELQQLAEINEKNINQIRVNINNIHNQLRRIQKTYLYATGNIEPVDKILKSYFGKSKNKNNLTQYQLNELSSAFYQLMCIFNLTFKIEGAKNANKRHA